MSLNEMSPRVLKDTSWRHVKDMSRHVGKTCRKNTSPNIPKDKTQDMSRRHVRKTCLSLLLSDAYTIDDVLVVKYYNRTLVKMVILALWARQDLKFFVMDIPITKFSCSGIMSLATNQAWSIRHITSWWENVLNFYLTWWKIVQCMTNAHRHGQAVVQNTNQ